MIPIADTSRGAAFGVKIHPRAKKNALTGEAGDALRLALRAPPVEGRANQACIEFLANLLKVPRSSVTIASGESSRRKVIRVAGISAEQVRTRLPLPATVTPKRARAPGPDNAPDDAKQMERDE